ncbi:PTS sugar transporter subunit IIA [bacterium]|nr:PTS sugar transporter subunit IIA [bacterium]
MLLTKFISKSCVAPEIEATSKAAALEELTELLFKRRRLKGVGAALEQVMGREAIESTGIGHGIAVPHARVAGLKDLMCAVGRASDGLDFIAVDREPVHLIFLICYPPSHQTTYLNFIATVAKLLRKEDSLQAILEAPSAADIFQVLEDLSETLVKPEERFAQDRAEQTEVGGEKGTHSDLVLMARLELCTEMLESARAGKDQIKRRIANISALLEPRTIEHYRRLKKGRGAALVSVEGGVCQGCYRQLPTELAQRLYRARGILHRCSHCNRFIYAV